MAAQPPNMDERKRQRPRTLTGGIAVLMLTTDGTDWALGNYFAFHGHWKRQLEAIVGHHVSLGVTMPGTPEDEAVRRSGLLLSIQ